MKLNAGTQRNKATGVAMTEWDRLQVKTFKKGCVPVLFQVAGYRSQVADQKSTRLYYLSVVIALHAVEIIIQLLGACEYLFIRKGVYNIEDLPDLSGKIDQV
jgi:hypothetical protein